MTAAADNTARIWDVASGDQIGELTGAQGVDAWHTGAVHDGRATFMMAIFSPDGSRILTTARDNTASLWDAASGRELLRLRGHDDFISGAAFSADGEQIVTAGRSDTTVRVWNARSGASVVLRGHRDSVGGAFFCAADRVLSWSNDGGARLWDMTSGHVVAEFDDAGGAIHGAVANQDCTRIVTAGQSGIARVWDARAFPPHLTLSGHGGGVDEAWFSPDGARAVTFSSEGDAMMMWDALTGRQLYVVSDISRGQNDVRWSPDGAMLATTSVDGSLPVPCVRNRT